MAVYWVHSVLWCALYRAGYDPENALQLIYLNA